MEENPSLSESIRGNSNFTQMRDQPAKGKLLPASLKPKSQQRNKPQGCQGLNKQRRLKKIPPKKHFFPLLENEQQKANQLEKQKGDSPASILKLCKYSQRYTQLDLVSKVNHQENQKRAIYCYQDDLQAYLIDIDSQFLVVPGKRKKPKLLVAGVDFIRKVSNDKNLKQETVLASNYFWHKLYHEFSKTDAELERYIAACLWIACKLEEYYPLRGSSLCNYWDNFSYNKYGCKYLSKLSLTVEELMTNELEVLDFLDFKVFTPSFINLLHLLEAAMFPTRNISCSRSAVSLLDACYYQPEIFSYSQASLAAGALFKLCQDREEENNIASIEAYLRSKNLLNLLTPSTIAGFMANSVEIRRKEVFARASCNTICIQAEDNDNGPLR